MEPNFRLTHELRGGEYARGDSPSIEGLPLNKYLAIAPVKIRYVHRDKLVLTDPPGDFETFYILQKLWRDSIIESAWTENLHPPLICPPVIDKDFNIVDGNHRIVAAGLHCSQIPVILIECRKDIEALRGLVDEGVFWWPHGDLTYRELMEERNRKASSMDLNEYFDKLADLENPEEEEQEGNDGEIKEKKEHRETVNLLQYCVGAAIHQVHPDYPDAETSVIPNVDFSNWWQGRYIVGNTKVRMEEAVSIVKKIVSENSAYSVDDVIQDVMVMLANVF